MSCKYLVTWQKLSLRIVTNVFSLVGMFAKTSFIIFLVVLAAVASSFVSGCVCFFLKKKVHDRSLINKILGVGYADDTLPQVFVSSQTTH